MTVWSAAIGELVGQSDAFLSIPTFVAFSPDGTRLATGMIDSTVLVRDVAKRREE